MTRNHTCTVELLGISGKISCTSILDSCCPAICECTCVRCSDRYKVFLDLTNLTSYLIPREFTPPLSRDMEHRLGVCTDNM